METDELSPKGGGGEERKLPDSLWNQDCCHGDDTLPPATPRSLSATGVKIGKRGAEGVENAEDNAGVGGLFAVINVCQVHIK